MPTEDVNLQARDVQQLSNRQAIASFFLSLEYDVSPITQTVDALGITAESLKRNIEHVEQIAEQEGYLHVYLVEVKSMRVTDRQALARTFRNKSGDYLFVITSDYESLDFVLLERENPEDQGTAFARKQVIVRPHVLTVNRRDPSPVALRVLRRFTYTETDVFYQFDKLLSAYIVAAWSETYFNNRALFSDYYLTERLPDTPAWQESPAPIYRELQGLLARVRERIGRADTDTTRAELIEPVFRALGWEWETVESGDARPDYALTRPSGGEPLALCLAYPWDRRLDTQDPRDAERSEDIPGQRVVSVLEGGEAPYVILTNGKLWRLYAAQAHSRATNYYEVDLEETLNSPDRDLAVRYFWLLFRADAFAPEEVQREGEIREMSFLDRVLEGSETYARELGERLKDRIFDAIFPRFAEGFIEYIRQTEGRGVEIDQERLDLIYQGTLTFLYRLMFLLYAEARALLPVNEARGYAEISLRRLKDEIADAAGSIEDEAPDHLRDAYSGTATDLYDRLTDLFVVIDRGDADRNVPRYNGGLFVTHPDPGPGDGSPEDRTARFLRDTKIPDRFLALGLDRLARDVDPKRHDLAMIDFKSLGVRQLGSIYEGLLEFKLRIAPEKMAIVRGKRTEEVIPTSEVKKQKVRGTLDAGAAYLENTRQERKATGSYYTPDYIVKYIVEHTVGPVLAEKFDALTPHLRAAEKAYMQNRKNAQAKSASGGQFEDPEKFWNRDDMLRLAYDVLDVKVLDPAMGSGHFLVEAVDFITDRLLNFLNGFPHNPVRASLSRTRQAILSAMDEQRVSIDQNRLNDVNLLKRQVLKRCVYGVDLNPMAVELAKVSLWLDAFTLGAPLSFLDHHLRCGNSLIGTMAQVAEEEMSRTGKGQFRLFQGPFVGLLQAADVMQEIAFLSDATIDQAERSANLFAGFEEKALPYKRLLDIYIMRHFGVTRASEFIETDPDAALAVMQGKQAISDTYHDLLEKQQELYGQYRFFHWDLEFPEVYIDLKSKDWSRKPGFDAVVGNPPYDVLSSKELGYDVSQQIEYFKGSPLFEEAIQGKNNLYKLFTRLSLALSRNQGFVGFIIPLAILGDWQSRPLRKWLLENKRFLHIEAFPQKDDSTDRVFPEAKLSTTVMILQNSEPTGEVRVNTYPGRHFVDVPRSYVFRPQEIAQYDATNFSIPIVGALDWYVARAIVTQDQVTYLGNIMTCNQGEVNVSTYSDCIHTNPTGEPFIKGSQVVRYEFQPPSQGELQWLDADCYHSRAGGPKTKHHLYSRIVMQGITGVDDARRILANLCPPGVYLGHSTNYVIEVQSDFSKLYLLALLNSTLFEWRFRQTSTNNNVNGYEIEALPICQVHFTTPDNQREATLLEFTNYFPNNLSAIESKVAIELREARTDTVHDLLGFLAEQMIDLNNQKKAEISRFLAWLESRLGVEIDDLSGKTIISGYLGDYQKDEAPLPVDELIDRLCSNKSKFAVNFIDALQHRIREAYQASLDVLLPIKQRLAETDWLIDQIVYRLYGLTDEEIAIVEGRG